MVDKTLLYTCSHLNIGQSLYILGNVKSFQNEDIFLKTEYWN